MPEYMEGYNTRHHSFAPLLSSQERLSKTHNLMLNLAPCVVHVAVQYIPNILKSMHGGQFVLSRQSVLQPTSISLRVEEDALIDHIMLSRPSIDYTSSLYNR